MFKVMWVPKKYKNVSYSEIVENARSVLKDAKKHGITWKF